MFYTSKQVAEILEDILDSKTQTVEYYQKVIKAVIETLNQSN